MKTKINFITIQNLLKIKKLRLKFQQKTKRQVKIIFQTEQSLPIALTQNEEKELNKRIATLRKLAFKINKPELQ